MLTDEMLRLINEEREREIRTNLRVRRLLGPRRPWIRWHHRASRLSSGEAAQGRPR